MIIIALLTTIGLLAGASIAKSIMVAIFSYITTSLIVGLIRKC
ncbi:hypothetical protein HOR40_gp03 [Pectobacterium phage PP74]|uniref:Uncharacterized protein n=1 Tax=Pectobacterium phage PP74 TaxID=1916101 RepID=A0A1J0MEK9_9CAUD|nr:hypothetical protein HOR40_gp03 [Pectobacterium phage PP74]APD19619.1 hypothetical protein PP74_03 [Pectobacterium phage PP74]